MPTPTSPATISDPQSCEQGAATHSWAARNIVRRLALGLLWSAVLTDASLHAAEESVFLRGFEVAPQDVVFGSVDGLRGDIAVINLGYAHGMVSGLTLVACRNVDGATIPISGLMVLSTEADHSRARVEGPFRVEPGDFVLVHASRLELWGGEPRLERLARERVLRRQTSTGYNTIDASPALIDEVARDDSFQGRQYISFERGTFVAKAAERVGPLKSRLGAVSTQPVLQNSTPADEEELKKKQPVDITLERLSRFVTRAESSEDLIADMATERLQVLRLLSSNDEVRDSNAPLLREVLIVWTKKALQSSL